MIITDFLPEVILQEFSNAMGQTVLRGRSLFFTQGNLYDFLRANDASTIAWPLRLRIARDIAEGMRFLHSATPPIIHRDLKSPNVLVSPHAAFFATSSA